MKLNIKISDVSKEQLDNLEQNIYQEQNQPQDLIEWFEVLISSTVETHTDIKTYVDIEPFIETNEPVNA